MSNEGTDGSVPQQNHLMEFKMIALTNFLVVAVSATLVFGSILQLA